MDKRKEEYIFGGILLVVLVVVAILLLVVRPKSVPGPVYLNDSGSTNASSWALQLNSNGGGVAHTGAKLDPLFHKAEVIPYPKNTFDTKSITTAINNDSSLKNFNGVCMKSVSFGTNLTLKYNNLTVKNFGCYLNLHPNTDLSKAITKTLSKINLSY
jgi:hypothetical protein